MAEKEEKELRRYLDTQPHGSIEVTEQETRTIVSLAENLNAAETIAEMREALDELDEYDGKVAMLTIIAIDAKTIERAVDVAQNAFSVATRKAMRYLREEVTPKRQYRR